MWLRFKMFKTHRQGEKTTKIWTKFSTNNTWCYIYYYAYEVIYFNNYAKHM